MIFLVGYCGMIEQDTLVGTIVGTFCSHGRWRILASLAAKKAATWMMV